MEEIDKLRAALKECCWNRKFCKNLKGKTDTWCNICQTDRDKTVKEGHDEWCPGSLLHMQGLPLARKLFTLACVPSSFAWGRGPTYYHCLVCCPDEAKISTKPRGIGHRVGCAFLVARSMLHPSECEALEKKALQKLGYDSM